MDDENLKPVLFTWGFDRSGHIYLDSFLEVTDRRADVQAAKMMQLRMRFQMTNMSMLRIPKDADRDDIKRYVESAHYDKSVVKKLKEAEVNLDDLIREPHALSSVNFILDLDI